MIRVYRAGYGTYAWADRPRACSVWLSRNGRRVIGDHGDILGTVTSLTTRQYGHFTMRSIRFTGTNGARYYGRVDMSRLRPFVARKYMSGSRG